MDFTIQHHHQLLLVVHHLHQSHAEMLIAGGVSRVRVKYLWLSVLAGVSHSGQFIPHKVGPASRQVPATRDRQLRSCAKSYSGSSRAQSYLLDMLEHIVWGIVGASLSNPVHGRGRAMPVAPGGLVLRDCGMIAPEGAEQEKGVREPGRMRIRVPPLIGSLRWTSSKNAPLPLNMGLRSPGRWVREKVLHRKPFCHSAS